MRVECFECGPVPLTDQFAHDEPGSVPLVAVSVSRRSIEAQGFDLSVRDLLVLCRGDERERDAPERGTGRHDPDTSLGCGLVGRVRLSASENEVLTQHLVDAELPKAISPCYVREELLNETLVVVLGLSAVNEHGRLVVRNLHVGPTRDLA